MELLWAVLAALWKFLLSYWILAFSLSVLTSLFEINFGVERLYLASLDAVFGWAVRFASIHEEEDEEDLSLSTARSASLPDSSASSQSLDKGLAPEQKRRPGIMDLLRKARARAEAAAKVAKDLPTPKATPPKRKGLIERDEEHMLLSEESIKEFRYEDTFCNLADDVIAYSKAAAEAIVEDELTSSFSVEELPFWNLLSRNKGVDNHGHFNWRLQSEELRRKAGNWLTLSSMRLFALTTQLYATFHDFQNAQIHGGGICVVNHTSPVDAVVLNTKVVYCLTGQIHGGWLGQACKALSKVVPHLWFDRSEAKDRSFVKQQLSAHARNTNNPPVLIFPEGVCVNNTAVVMFKKGAFEAANTIYPIAMRYNPRYGDAFWVQDGWSEYVFAMLSCWAIVVDVYYLPKMERMEGESVLEFADRVKAAIAAKVGLRFLKWDGRLNQYTVVKSDLLEEQRARLGRRLRNLSGNPRTLDADTPRSVSIEDLNDESSANQPASHPPHSPPTQPPFKAPQAQDSSTQTD